MAVDALRRSLLVCLGLAGLGVAVTACDPGAVAGRPPGDNTIVVVDPHDGVAEPSPWPAAQTDRTAAIGGPDTVEFATWNVENFPASAATPEIVADLIASMAIDVVALQEIASEDAFAELVGRLPGYAGVLSTHSYGDGTFQKLGMVYRRTSLDVTMEQLLFQGSGWPFPRPALEVTGVLPNGETIGLVVVHLKAGGGGQNEERRQQAIELITTYVDVEEMRTGHPFVVLGDFNDDPTRPSGQRSFAPMLAHQAYTFRTLPLAEAGAVTFLPSSRALDHIVTTDDFGARFTVITTKIPTLDEEVWGYRENVSDHLPAILVFDAP